MIPQYRPIIDRESLAKETSDYILGDGFFTEYKKTEEFEQAICKLLNVKYCSMVNNGTISLSLALLAMGIKAGDSVLVPNITMIATCNAVKLIGAKPIFVDVNHTNLCMDLYKAQTLVEKNFVKAVIYVTLNGRSHSQEELLTFKKSCDFYGVAIIQDNAQSLGSNYSNGTPISCLKGGIGSFSFSMPKIITTGQGGCLVTNDDKLAMKIKKLKDFGRMNGGMDIHDEFGINSKFTEIQAIMGLNQLNNIQVRIFSKEYIYAIYDHALMNISEVYMFPYTGYTPWFVDIYIDDRDKLQSYLKEKGIGTRAIYPELTSQLVNKKWLQPKTLKVSGKYSNKGLWLPSSLDIKEEEIKFICDTIKEFYAK